MTERQFLRWQATMRIFRRIFRCHQLAERSFSFRGIQFPLCARCTGILLGFLLLGPIITVLTPGNPFLSLALIGVMVLDGSLQFFGVFPSNNPRRLLSGLGAGYALCQLAVYAVRGLILLCR